MKSQIVSDIFLSSKDDIRALQALVSAIKPKQQASAFYVQKRSGGKHSEPGIPRKLFLHAHERAVPCCAPLRDGTQY